MNSNLHPDIQYLQQPQIGKVISQALSDLYLAQPNKPVTFLYKWLYNHLDSQKKEAALRDDLIEQDRRRELYRQQLIKKMEEEKKRQEEIEAQKAADEAFMKIIREHQYHEELLFCDFPNYLERKFKLTGVYIGVLDHPLKTFTDADDDENAHLDMAAEKVIRYIGYSTSHEFVKDITLGGDCVCAEIFKVPEEGEEQPKVDMFGNQIVEPKNIYYEDVNSNPRLQFFSIPKLGAWLAVLLSYKSCDNDTVYDSAIEQRLKWKKAMEDHNMIMREKEEEFLDIIQKRKDAEEDITDVEQEMKMWKESLEDPLEDEFQKTTREFVICFDTLGQDREILDEDRKDIFDLLAMFIEHWEASEAAAIKEDVDLQMKYLESVEFRPRDTLETLQEDEDRYVEENPEKYDEVREEESKYNLGMDLTRIDKYVQELRNPPLRENMEMISKLRVVKYPTLFQAVFLMLGYGIEVNSKGFNKLNWKENKEKLNDETFFDKIENFVIQGPKPEEFPVYQKLNHLQKRFEKLPLEDIDNYNIAMGRLLRWALLVIKARKSDIEIRRAEKAKLKAERQELLQQEEQRLEERQKALDEAIAENAPKEKEPVEGEEGGEGEEKEEKEEEEEEEEPEEGEEEEEKFSPERFLEEWDEEHPPIEIPEEIIDDIDNDLEEEETEEVPQ